MKSIFLFLALFIGTTIFSFAQSLVLIHEGEELDPFTVIQVVGQPFNPELVVELDVRNTSSSTIETNVTRYITNLTNGHVATFCWAEQCYGPGTVTAPNTVILEAGATTTQVEAFSGHVNPNTNLGTTIIAYTFFDIDNPSDSTQVVIHFEVILTEVRNISDKNVKVSTYPNPATDVLNMNINAELNEVVTYELLNITGSVIRNDASQSNSAKFNVSDLAEGLYIYRVSSKKEIIKTGRVVIKH